MRSIRMAVFAATLCGSAAVASAQTPAPSATTTTTPVLAADTTRCAIVRGEARDDGTQVFVRPGGVIQVAGKGGCAPSAAKVTVSLDSEPIGDAAAFEDGSYVIASSVPLTATLGAHTIVVDSGAGRPRFTRVANVVASLETPAPTAVATGSPEAVFTAAPDGGSRSTGNAVRFGLWALAVLLVVGALTSAAMRVASRLGSSGRRARTAADAEDQVPFLEDHPQLLGGDEADEDFTFGFDEPEVGEVVAEPEVAGPSEPTDEALDDDYDDGVYEISIDDAGLPPLRGIPTTQQPDEGPSTSS